MGKVTLPRIREILAGFKKRNILVVGDLMLDKFIWGKVSRISPEAPIPVVEVESVSTMPGGAANVVNNICSLGGRGHSAGVVGRDAEGRDLIRLLGERGADTAAVLASSSVETIVKTRIIAHHQHVVRIDREHSIKEDSVLTKKLLALIRTGMRKMDAIILEDYGKGVLTDDLVRAVVDLARHRKIIVTADPKIEHELDFSDIDAITPNYSEAFYFAGMNSKKGDSVEEAGKALLRKWKGAAVLVTLGDRGMCLFQTGKKPRHISTAPKDVFDVAGAGDTVIAVLTMALASGADMYEAAVTANLAAGVVVQKSGVETPRREEIIEAAKTELQA